MTVPSRIVIIGASLAGGSAAKALRAQGFTGALTLIGAEADLPYERPPLSKGLMLGDTNEPDWVLDSAAWADENVTMLTQTIATEIRPADHVVIANGHEYGYDKLLLATGSAARRLTTPGADLDGIHTLRSLPDALALRAKLTKGARLVIVGAGWIGCEVAAAARHHDVEVVMIDPLAQPLIRVLGERVGAAFAGLHREHDVDLRLGRGVTGFEGDRAVSGVRLDDGSLVPADLVLLGVGAAPDLSLAKAAGLEVDSGGVAVDAALRSSDADIYAAGDVAAHAHPNYAGRIRVEHWDTAKEQGTHVAANLLGAQKPYTKRPFFFSDQYDLGCEYRGHADPENDELVIRGDLGRREFIAFWVRDGAVVAALNVNQWDDGDALDELVNSGRQVTRTQLSDGDLAAL